MSIHITSRQSGAEDTPRDVAMAMWTGARSKCPACRSGRLYGNYLKVRDTCATCGTELHHQRADDAPPYFTMLIVGHVLVGGALWLEQTWHPSVWLHLLIWMPLTLALSLWLLPRIKGALVGLQWACRMHGFGAGPDASSHAHSTFETTSKIPIAVAPQLPRSGTTGHPGGRP